MRKRGLSHVEMILSFLLFASALAFGLYFFSPVDTERFVDVSSSYAIREILGNASARIDSFSVRINNENGAIERDNSPWEKTVAINLSGICDIGDVNPVVEDIDGNILKAKIGAGFEGCNSTEKDIVYVLNNEQWRDGDFIIIRISEAFQPLDLGGVNTIGDPRLNESFYTISSYRKKKIILEERILELNKTYHEDYDGLKESFNLPGRTDFGFSLTFSSGEIIEAKKQIRENTDVFTETLKVEVMRKNQRLEFADLTILIW